MTSRMCSEKLMHILQAAQSLSQMGFHKDNPVRVLAGPLRGQEGSVFDIYDGQPLFKFGGDIKTMEASDIGRLVRAS